VLPKISGMLKKERKKVRKEKVIWNLGSRYKKERKHVR